MWKKATKVVCSGKLWMARMIMDLYKKVKEIIHRRRLHGWMGIGLSSTSPSPGFENAINIFLLETIAN